MPAQLLDGKALAAKLLEDLIVQSAALERRPGLAAILVGSDPASELYVGLKEKACLTAGIKFEKHALPENAGQSTLIGLIDGLNSRADIDAILLQLPLPEGHNYGPTAAIAAITPSKDVDGFHPDNLLLLQEGHPRLVPGLAAGIVALVKSAAVPLQGKRAVVIANSHAFFEPLEVILRNEGIASMFCQPSDPDLLMYTQTTDVVIVAVGRAGFLKGDMIKNGAIVIDVGTNRVGLKTVGDADDSVREVAGFLTPVPGGVGPMTVAMVVMNAVRLAGLRQLP